MSSWLKGYETGLRVGRGVRKEHEREAARARELERELRLLKASVSCEVCGEAVEGTYYQHPRDAKRHRCQGCHGEEW